MGKKVIIFGDSISTGTHGGGYEQGLADLLQTNEIYNYAASESGISLMTPSSVLEKLSSQPKIIDEADFIVLWSGTNDWYWDVPLGGRHSDNPNTFNGAAKHVIQLIRKYNKRAIIIWPSPLLRIQNSNANEQMNQPLNEAWNQPNGSGVTMSQIYYAIIELCQEFGIYFVDMRLLTGINEGNATLYLEDNVHPNSSGNKKIIQAFSTAFYQCGLLV